MSADDLDQLLDAIAKPSPAGSRINRQNSSQTFVASPATNGSLQIQAAYPQYVDAPVGVKRLEIISKNLNNLLPPNRGDRSPFVAAPPPVAQNRSLPPSGGASNGTTAQAFATYASGEVCDTCRRPISSGQLLRVDNLHYHMDHFSCQKCQRSIGTDAYYRTNGLLVCKNCLSFDMCRMCSRPIESGERVSAMGGTFHGRCFACAQCQGPLSEYFEKEGRPYCSNCYNNAFGKKCGGCGGNIGNSPSLSAINRNWHYSCFTCVNCRTEIGNSSFYTTRDGYPRCQRCGPPR